MEYSWDTVKKNTKGKIIVRPESPENKFSNERNISNHYKQVRDSVRTKYDISM